MALGIIPNEQVEAVAVEDDRALAELGFGGVGIQLGLRAAGLGGLGGALGFNQAERLAVVIPQHIVDVANTGGILRLRDFNFLPHFLGVLAIAADLPAGRDQHGIH